MIDFDAFDVSVELCLALMPIVGADSVGTEEKLVAHIVDEADGVLLVVPPVKFIEGLARDAEAVTGGRGVADLFSVV